MQKQAIFVGSIAPKSPTLTMHVLRYLDGDLYVHFVNLSALYFTQFYTAKGALFDSVGPVRRHSGLI